MQRTLPFVLLAGVLTGCTGSPREQATLDCSSLRQVVDAAPGDFASIAGSRRVTRYGDTRTVRLEPYGDCSVFSSAGNPPRYLCSAPSTDQLADRERLVQAVQTCLGPDWERSELPGGGAKFDREGVQVSVGRTDREASHASNVGLTVQRLR